MIPPGKNVIRKVDAQDIPLAGELGARLCEEIAAVSVADKPIEMDGLTRRHDGKLQLRVSRNTFMVLSGQAELTF